MKKVGVIGSGFAGLAAATCLAHAGFQVSVYEKNSSPGGRARKFSADGYSFDMGPSWYWMPDVFDKYFALFGKTTSDYYFLKRLDPSYRIYFGRSDVLDVPANRESLLRTFEQLELGGSKNLVQFLEEGKFKYEAAMNSLIYKPGLSYFEFADRMVIQGVFKLHLFQSMSTYLRKFFKAKRILQLLEFPGLFLGATAEKTPALYSLMNYADIALGTWYPQGGFHQVVAGMEKLALEKGVVFHYNHTVEGFDIHDAFVKAITVNGLPVACDYVVAGADYHHVEQKLLPEKYRQYTSSYWKKRVMAPSSLLFYIGVNKKISGLLHHTLFFDEDFTLHAKEIYDVPKWPTAPQFYVSCTSQTDNTVAPEGCENLVILIPVAPGLADDEATREKYYTIVMDRLEKITGQSLQSHVVFKRSYAHNDFLADYNAFQGNAYGLANTLFQTSIFKPSIVNKKVKNLFYAGQLTVPGPGVPPSLISGQVAARLIIDRENE